MTEKTMKQIDEEIEEYEFRNAMRKTLIHITNSGNIEQMRTANAFLDAMGYTYIMTTHIDRMDKSHKWLICQVEKKWR